VGGNDTSLPLDVIDTGLRRGDQAMWQAADGNALYVGDGQSVEKWPEVDKGFGCD